MLNDTIRTGLEASEQKFNASALESRHQEVKFTEMQEFESNYGEILDKRDVRQQQDKAIYHLYILQVDPSLTQQVRDRIKNKTAHTVQVLESEARQVTKELGTQRAADTADIDGQYGRLLSDFIVTNEV